MGTTPDSEELPPSNLRAGLFAGLLTFLGLLATEPTLAIVWDEGYTLGREQRVRWWFQAIWDPPTFSAEWSPPPAGSELVQPEPVDPATGFPRITPPQRPQISNRQGLMDPEVLQYFWPFAREEPHGHPPFYALLGLAGDLLTPWRGDLERARLGPILLYSFGAVFTFRFVDRRYGRLPAVLMVGALLLQPRLFAQAHYAAYDGPLTILWLLSLISFAKAVEGNSNRSGSPNRPHRLATIAFGLLLGAAASTKLTGWFLPFPFLCWVVLYRSRVGAIVILGAIPMALLGLYLFNPPWWPDPVAGIHRFLASNLTRGESIPIGIEFLGRRYMTPNQSLPWYNTVLWTIMVTPIVFLLLGVIGAIGSVLRLNRERVGVLVGGHWLFLLVLRALPNVPGHDGVRLFLPAFGLLGLSAAIGASFLFRWNRRLGQVVVTGAIIEGLVSVALMMPVPLSYYSPLIGGLPGAEKLGMEPTYYWDSLTQEVTDWLNQNTPANSRIVSSTYTTSFAYLNRAGDLRPTLGPSDKPIQWYLIQNRPGSFRDLDRALIRSTSARPAFVFKKFGVPLLYVYSDDDVQRALMSRTPER